MKSSNENETWQPLSLATRRLLELCEQKQPDNEGDAPNDSQERDKSADHDKAVEQGLRQIERFERRYRR